MRVEEKERKAKLERDREEGMNEERKRNRVIEEGFERLVYCPFYSLIVYLSFFVLL